jgi:hypothetical protein
MQAGIFNLTDGNAIQQGSDFAFSLVYKNAVRVPVDLTEAVIDSEIKADWNSPALAAFTITTSDDATDGYIGLSLPASDSSTMPPNRYKYDVRVSIDGNTQHIIKGFCDIIESTTLS